VLSFSDPAAATEAALKKLARALLVACEAGLAVRWGGPLHRAFAPVFAAAKTLKLGAPIDDATVRGFAMQLSRGARDLRVELEAPFGEPRLRATFRGVSGDYETSFEMFEVDVCDQPVRNRRELERAVRSIVARIRDEGPSWMKS
jgi:hypothetical protein